MHIERLRRAQPTLHIAAPKKPGHLKQNLKKELSNLGKPKSPDHPRTHE